MSELQNEELAFKLMKILRLAIKGYSSSCMVHLVSALLNINLCSLPCVREAHCHGFQIQNVVLDRSYPMIIASLYGHTHFLA